MKTRIWLILLIGLVLRLIALNQSLWLDEGTTAKVMIHFSALDYLTKFAPFDFHPPLYYLFMKLWTNIFGYSEIMLRMPSVIFSLLAGYVIYRIAKLFILSKAEGLNGYMVGIFAAAFFLFNPLIVYYSQEARMYMMTTFLLTCSLYWLIKILPTQNSNPKSQIQILNLKSIFLFNISMFFSFTTFYGSIFLIIPMLILLFYKKQYKSFLISFLIFTFSFLILLPLLLQQFQHSRESLIAVSNWKSVLGTANLKNLLMIPIKFAFGRINFYPKWLYYLISGSWSIFVWTFVIKGMFSRIKKQELSIKNYLLFLLICSLGIGLFFSIHSPLLQYFRFMYLIPIMSILLSIGLSRKLLFDRGGRTVALGFVILSAIYLLFSQFHREDWKTLSESLNPAIPIYMIKSSSDALAYYRPDIKINELRNMIPVENKLYIVPYTSDIYGYDYKKVLTDNGYKKKNTTTFNQLTYEIWKK